MFLRPTEIETLVELLDHQIVEAHTNGLETVEQDFYQAREWLARAYIELYGVKGGTNS